jgi:hypothetical protein
MRVENTFCNHTPEDYVTYTSIPTNFHPAGISSMHDIFACSQSLHKRIHDCKAVPHGAISDHKAVRLSLMLTLIKFCGHTVSRGAIDWPKILSDEHTRAMYNKHLLMLMTTGPTQWDDHQELILQAGALTATTHKRQCEGWFQMNRSTLAPLYTERNTLKHAIKHASHLPPAIQTTMQFDLTPYPPHLPRSIPCQGNMVRGYLQEDSQHAVQSTPSVGAHWSSYQRRNSAPQQDDKYGNVTP